MIRKDEIFEMWKNLKIEIFIAYTRDWIYTSQALQKYRYLEKRILCIYHQPILNSLGNTREINNRQIACFILNFMSIYKEAGGWA